tara:strand:- start:44 stop:829 length:786 start_codon:yes stop_codon:yes gene_type:complete
MNKKFGVAVLFLIVLSITLVIAIENPLEERVDDLEEKVEDVEEFIEDKDIRSEYLTKEWTKFLEKTSAGKILLWMSNILSKFSPVFKVILGVGYSLSWAFFFSVAIWIMFFVVLLGPIDAMFYNKLLAIATSFIVASLIGLAGIIKKILGILVTVVDSTLAIWLSVIAGGILIFILYAVGQRMGEQIKKSKKKSEEEATKRAQKEIQAAGEVAEKSFEYESGMRRGGTGKRRSQFVGKKLAERYNRRFGDNVSKKRFDKKK